MSEAAFAFRSGRDLPDLAGTERVKFANDQITFGLQKDLPNGLKLASVEAAIAKATASWSAPECSAVQFAYIGSSADHAAPGDGVNTIEWVSDWDARGFPADAPGATDVQYIKTGGQWAIAEADMYLNRGYSWTTDASGASDARDVVAVLTHESGHMLGLLHPCEPDGAGGAPTCSSDFSDSFAGATMYPFYSPSEATLSQDDIDGVCFLYSKQACPVAGCPDGQTCSAEGCVASCGDQVCQTGQVCTNEGCKSQSACEFSSCAGLSCLTDAGCGAFDHCLAGTCVHGDRANGDPCTTGADCDEGGCLSGVCSRECSDDSECGVGHTCDASARACSSSLSALGEPCTDPTACVGGVCVSGAENTPVCSRACGDMLAVCPSGWSCDQIDGKEACAPLATSRSGCSVSWGGASSPLVIWGFGLALVGIVARKRWTLAIRS